MTIDLNNSIDVSIKGIGIVFLISIILLCVTNPCYIMEINNKGQKRKNIFLLISYSLLFAISTGIIILFVTQHTSSKEMCIKFKKSLNPRAYSPKVYDYI